MLTEVKNKLNVVLQSNFNKHEYFTKVLHNVKPNILNKKLQHHLTCIEVEYFDISA